MVPKIAINLNFLFEKYGLSMFAPYKKIVLYLKHKMVELADDKRSKDPLHGSRTFD
jgi:hypothetical protein